MEAYLLIFKQDWQWARQINYNTRGPTADTSIDRTPSFKAGLHNGQYQIVIENGISSTEIFDIFEENCFFFILFKLMGLNKLLYLNFC